MIVGIGTDLIEIERIKKACEKEAFLVRVYTEEERRQAGGKGVPARRRFAGKRGSLEGVWNRLSGLWTAGYRSAPGRAWKTVGAAHGGAKKLADSLKITRIHVSITNTGSLASAYAVGEGEWK